MEWCCKGYDYVGAPWIKKRFKYIMHRFLLTRLAITAYRFLFKKDFRFSRINRLNRVGNGGLSLRKISTMIDCCNKYQSAIDFFLKQKKDKYNEDRFWALVPKNMRYPDIKEALKFSFDMRPEHCYKLTKGQLPFGAHGVTKSEYIDFWSSKIGQLKDILYAEKSVLPIVGRTIDYSEERVFSILIPTWNNLDYLKLTIDSIRKNSSCNHQIILQINDGRDGTLEWVKSQPDIEYTYTAENIGVCWSLNAMRSLVKSNYIVYSNDDMYLLPRWDSELVSEIERIGHKMFFLSSTLIQPRPFFCKGIIAPANYGEDIASFNEEKLLKEYMNIEHYDWYGSTWPVNVVHKDVWDLVGGYSVEYTPGMYSDPDFSAKLYLAGVRIFKGVNASRVYHFEARSTGRVVRNKGSRQFLAKWGITSSTFTKYILRRGEPLTSEYISVNSTKLRANVKRSKLKRALQAFRKIGVAKNIWEI